MVGGAPGSLVGIGSSCSPVLEAPVLFSTPVDRRAALLVSAIHLSVFTIAWNGAVGAAALLLSFLDNSLALAALALNALLDSSASAVLVWRFRTEQRDFAAFRRWIIRAAAEPAARRRSSRNAG